MEFPELLSCRPVESIFHFLYQVASYVVKQKDEDVEVLKVCV